MLIKDIKCVLNFIEIQYGSVKLYAKFVNNVKKKEVIREDL